MPEENPTFWRAVLEPTYKVLAIVLTLGTMVGSTTAAYWAVKQDSADVRKEVKELSASTREGAASLREDLAQIAIQTEKHIGRIEKSVVAVREAVTSLGHETEKHITILHRRVDEQDSTAKLRDDVKKIELRIDRLSGQKGRP